MAETRGLATCPNDTDGDGNCGRPACPQCGALAVDEVFDEAYWRAVDKHGKTCKNCGRPIKRCAMSSTGWTHDEMGWQGVRCQGRVCGAMPVVPE